jgi:uncharacterized RDD family membrane protein YckC
VTESVVETEVGNIGPAQLATRKRRLGASLLDAVLLAMIVVPLEFMSGFWVALHRAVLSARITHVPYPYEFRLTALAYGLATFVVLQSYPLMASGQTWGKRMLRIKIVDMHGNKPSLFWLLGVREIAKWVVSSVPFVGSPAVIGDMLLIFRSDRRCGHDWMAGTRVVELCRVE